MATKCTEWHSPEQIVRKLRDAEFMPNAIRPLGGHGRETSRGRESRRSVAREETTRRLASSGGRAAPHWGLRSGLIPADRRGRRAEAG